MNKAELSKAVEMAKRGAFSDVAGAEAGHIFNGFGLAGFIPVVCTLEHVAALIAWQCIMLNGEMDAEALNEVWAARRRFVVVDGSVRIPESLAAGV